MPRKPRIDHPGLLHHVIARGIERRRIFLSQKDYGEFLEILARSIERSSASCFAWALMPNHVHLLIRAGKEGLSPIMRRMLTAYAVRFNHRYKRAGHLFQNRYKSIVCQEDSYLLELVRYIHLNPLKAGLVNDMAGLSKYPWTGHAVILGRRNAAWQSKDEVLAMFGHNAEKAYERFVAEGWARKRKPDLSGGGLVRSVGSLTETLRMKSTDRQSYDERILGDGHFVEGVWKMARQEITQKELSLEALTDRVSIKAGLSSQDLTRRSRQRKISEAKAVLISLGIDHLGKRGSELAQWTQMSPSAVSQALQRGRILMQDPRWHSVLNN